MWWVFFNVLLYYLDEGVGAILIDKQKNVYFLDMYLIRNDGGETKKIEQKWTRTDAILGTRKLFPLFLPSGIIDSQCSTEVFFYGKDTEPINQLLTTYQGGHVTYFISIIAKNCPPVF